MGNDTQGATRIDKEVLHIGECVRRIVPSRLRVGGGKGLGAGMGNGAVGEDNLKPEDIIQKKEKAIRDLIPRPIPQPIRLEAILREIQSMKIEIAKIKLALRAQGIAIE